MATPEQYTLDCDPMVLAMRMKTLEETVDMLSGCVCDLVDSLRVIANQCDKALCEDSPLQAGRIYDEHGKLAHVHDRAHAASVKMGRSY